MAVSIVMAIIPAVGIIGLALFFDPAQGVTLDLNQAISDTAGTMDFVGLLTTNDFSSLLYKSNILALIIMSVIAGVAIGQSGEDGRKVSALLDSFNTVIMKIVSIIMVAAPLGLGAYFASTMASQDPSLWLLLPAQLAYLWSPVLFISLWVPHFTLGLAGARKGLNNSGASP